MIDIPLTVYLALIALMFGSAIAFDYRRRARVANDRRERDLRAAMAKAPGRNTNHERSST